MIFATVGCGAAPKASPAERQTVANSHAKLQAELQAIVDKYIDDSDGPAVSVRVESPAVGNVVAHQGLANLDKDTPVRDSDRFRIGSVTKTFVAVIMLQFAEEHLLSLDDPAAKYLPDEIVNRIANVDKVTIRQLLNHTSGIDDYYSTDEFDDAIGTHQSELWTPEEALTYAYDLPALFEVGERHSYSNTNYLLLQMIMEKVGKEPWGAQVKSRIAEPLGLKDTYAEHFETRKGGTVRSYEDKTKKDVTDVDDGTGLADGGVISTTADLATYVQALISGDVLLSRQSRKQMQDWVDDGDDGLYGLGLMAIDYDDDEDGVMIGHDGTASGFGAEMWFNDNASQSTIIMLFASEGLQEDPGQGLFDAVDTWASRQ